MRSCKVKCGNTKTKIVQTLLYNLKPRCSLDSITSAGATSSRGDSAGQGPVHPRHGPTASCISRNSGGGRFGMHVCWHPALPQKGPLQQILHTLRHASQSCTSHGPHTTTDFHQPHSSHIGHCAVRTSPPATMVHRTRQGEKTRPDPKWLRVSLSLRCVTCRMH